MSAAEEIIDEVMDEQQEPEVTEVEPKAEVKWVINPQQLEVRGLADLDAAMNELIADLSKKVGTFYMTGDTNSGAKLAKEIEELKAKGPEQNKEFAQKWLNDLFGKVALLVAVPMGLGEVDRVEVKWSGTDRVGVPEVRLFSTKGSKANPNRDPNSSGGTRSKPRVTGGKKRYEEAWELHESGLSDKEVASEMGLGSNTGAVSNYLRRYREVYGIEE